MNIYHEPDLPEHLRQYFEPAPQYGLENTPEEYVAHLVELFREMRRALNERGTVWLNLGDSYCGTGNKGDLTDPKYEDGRNGQKIALNNKIQGLKSKDLVGIPWRVAFALQSDGWYLRQDIIWHKPNPMPESVTDRCTKSHEYIFLLSKSQRYYFDHDAILEKATYQEDINRPRNGRTMNMTSKTFDSSMGGGGTSFKNHSGGFKADGTPIGSRKRKFGANNQTGTFRQDTEEYFEDTGYRNKRSVWTVTTKPFSGAHFATFPPDLIEPMVLAGCPNGGLIYDPFMGAGTTGVVCVKNGRNYIGTEINPEYVKIAEKRISNTDIGLL